MNNSKNHHPAGHYVFRHDTTLDKSRIRMSIDIQNKLGEHGMEYVCFKGYSPQKNLLLVPKIDEDEAVRYLRDRLDPIIPEDFQIIKHPVNLTKDGRFSFPDWLLHHIGAVDDFHVSLVVLVREKGWIEIFRYDLINDWI